MVAHSSWRDGREAGSQRWAAGRRVSVRRQNRTCNPSSPTTFTRRANRVRIRAIRTRLAKTLEQSGRGLRKLGRRVAPGPVPIDDETQRDRWSRLLDRAYSDIVVLHDYQASWDELVAVVDDNPYIPAPNHVMDFVRDLYGIVVAVGVRRQVDRNGDVAGLARLIDEIARSPTTLTRAWWLERYPAHLEDLGNADFDQFAGPGGSIVDPEIVRKDLATLGNVAAKVKRYVNQNLAHLADEPDGPAGAPTFADIRKCLTELDRLLRRYRLLINGDSLMTSTPTKQFNFRLPLLVPWAPNDRALQYLRSTDPDMHGAAIEVLTRQCLAEGRHPTVEQVAGLLALIDALRAEAHGRGQSGRPSTG